MNLLLNTVPLSEMTFSGRPNCFHQFSKNSSATFFALTLFEQAMKTLYFENESTMTSMALFPLSSGYLVIISYDTCCQGWVGTLSGFKGMEMVFGSQFH